MEFRVLRYFLEVAREGNITRAAERLHVSQPTLSKQLKDLEGELGKKLFVRSNYSVKLTDEGMLLRKRAEDILEMVDKTADEFKAMGEISASAAPSPTGSNTWPGASNPCKSDTPVSGCTCTAATPRMCRSGWTRVCWTSRSWPRRWTCLNIIIWGSPTPTAGAW